MPRIKGTVTAFGAFWWDFIVGDDWKIAAGVVLALALTGLLDLSSLPAWWLLPVAVLGVLSLSLSVALRQARPS